MGVSNLADVRSFNDYIRTKLVKRVASCPPQMIEWRPAPNKWSVSEHVEHLARAEQIFVHWISHLAGEGQAKGLTGRPQQVDAIPPLMALGDAPLAASGEMLPQGRPLEESLARLEMSRAELNQLYDRLGLLDTDHLTRPFLTMELNAAQLMHLVGLHELRHERHLANLVEAWQVRQS